MKGILQTEFLPDLAVDGGNCQSSALGASKPGSPQKLPRGDTGAVEGSRMPIIPQGRPELLGMGTPRSAGACQHGRSGKERGREGDRWAAMET